MKRFSKVIQLAGLITLFVTLPLQPSRAQGFGPWFGICYCHLKEEVPPRFAGRYDSNEMIGPLVSGYVRGYKDQQECFVTKGPQDCRLQCGLTGHLPQYQCHDYINYSPKPVHVPSENGRWMEIPNLVSPNVRVSIEDPLRLQKMIGISAGAISTLAAIGAIMEKVIESASMKLACPSLLFVPILPTGPHLQNSKYKYTEQACVLPEPKLKKPLRCLRDGSNHITCNTEGSSTPIHIDHSSEKIEIYFDS